MRDYYADFLQNKNSVNTLPKAVSKGSKGRILDKKQAFDTFDTALPSIIPEIYVPRNSYELSEYKTEKLHEVLNRFIRKGVGFDVFVGSFKTIDPAQVLKTSDVEFLELNNAAILCTFQQSLLVKHLFNHSPEQLEDFIFDLVEREAIMTNGGDIPFAVHCEAVKDVSRNWFDRLLNSLETAETICRLLAADAAQDTANGKASLD